MLDNRTSPNVQKYVKEVVDVLRSRPDCGALSVSILMFPKEESANAIGDDMAVVGATDEISDDFKFSFHQVVKLKESGEVGTIIGRAQYINAANSYRIRYCAGDGRQVEAWWSEDSFETA